MYNRQGLVKFNHCSLYIDWELQVHVHKYSHWVGLAQWIVVMALRVLYLELSRGLVWWDCPLKRTLTTAGTGVAGGRGSQGFGVGCRGSAPRVGEGCEVVSVGVHYPWLAWSNDLIRWYVGLTGKRAEGRLVQIIHCSRLDLNKRKVKSSYIYTLLQGSRLTIEQRRGVGRGVPRIIWKNLNWN